MGEIGVMEGDYLNSLLNLVPFYLLHVCTPLSLIKIKTILNKYFILHSGRGAHYLPHKT